MRNFEYQSPHTVDETIQLLGQIGANVPLAGGTDLLTLMKAGLIDPDRLIDIKRLDEIPHGIAKSTSGITIGALTTLAEIESSELIQSQFPVLAQAAALAATPQLRNMATIGGNLLQRPRCWYFRDASFHCWLKGGVECQAKDGQNQLHALYGDSPCVAVHPSDPASALLALNARVQLRGPQGERTLALDEFFTLPEENHRRENAIAPDELLMSIQIPPQIQGARSLYLKAMDRKVWAFALVGVAVWLHVQGDIVSDIRLVLSGVAPIPWRLTNAEQMLKAQRLDEPLIIDVVESALDDAMPLAENGYKISLAKGLLHRALSHLAQEA